MENIADVESRMRVPLRLLRDITNNFSDDRLIGEGGYGAVYKGVCGDGEVIAVKILHHVLETDDEQFRNEIASLMKIRHRNIVRLVGYCYEQEEHLVPYSGKHVLALKTHRALCFEYMHNGSLDRHISDTSSGLDWHTRYAAIKGVCEGLRYLHEGWGTSIIHGDLKPDNILLDGNLMPKISDFGLSRLIGEGNAKRMGTIGYMPPEFIERQVTSHKYDIFSLGVIIIQMILGRRLGCNDAYSNEFIEPVVQVREKWRERLQKTVNGMPVERNCQQITKCLEIALKCVEYDRHERPSIGEILNRLNEIETMIPEDVRAVQNRFDSRKSLMLHVYPPDLYFPFVVKGRKKDIASCSLHLKNSGDDCVAFMLVSSIPKIYLIKKPFCGVVPPMSTCTLTLTKLKQTPPTSSDSSDFFTLYSAVVGQYNLLADEKDYTHYSNFFKKSAEYSDKVQVVKLKVICDQPTAKFTGTSLEDRGRVSPRNFNDVSFFTLKTRAKEHDRKIL